MGIDIYRGNDKQLTEGAINTTARPGAVDPRAQQIDVFPLDAFEFDDPKRIADPIVRLKRPWKWEVQSDIDEAFADILVLQAMTTFETRYKKSNTLPDTPVGDDPDGWETTISTANPELPVWQSGATRDSYGAIVGTWYTPVRFTGAATIIGALTNDVHQVPTDIDGNFGNYTGAESKLYIYEGAQDVTAEFEMSYLASEGITVDDAYFTTNKVVRVTAMSVDAGSVNLIGTRVATVITKSFTISKAKQGDASPAYSLSAETVVALVKPNGDINPSSITFSSTYQTGLTAPQPFEAVFRFLVNGVLQFETTTKQSSYSWSGFDDILLYDSPDIILYNTPDIILPFNYTGDDPLAYMTVQIWSPTAGATPDLWLPDVLLDSQSVTFIADWENYTDEILAAVPDYSPRYLGRFGPLEVTRYPALYRKGDTWLVYDTDDTPYVRGVYYYDGVATPYRLTDAQSSDSGFIAAALPDILWATKEGFGATNLYGAVTYIENLVSNAIFTDSIQIGQSNVADLDTTLYDLEVAAALDASTKAGAVAAIVPRYRGTLSTNPVTDLRLGDYYYNDTNLLTYAFNGTIWESYASGSAYADYVAEQRASAVADIVPRYRGQLATAPVTDLRAGDYYYNTTNDITYAYSGTAWDSYAAGTAYADAAATQAKIDAELLAKDSLAYRLGYADWAAMEADARLGATLIDGGYLRTTLIEVEKLLTQYITVKSGGSIRYETGSGVQKRSVQLADEKIDWLDTPDTSPASPEQLRARIGRLGVGSSILMDGEFLTSIDATWTTPSAITVGIYSSAIQVSNGDIHLFFTNINGLNQKIYSNGAWGTTVLIESGTFYAVDAIALSDGTIRVSYTYGSSFIAEKVWNGTTWSAGTLIRSGSYSTYVEREPGDVRIAIQVSVTIYEYALQGGTWVLAYNITTGGYPDYIKRQDGSLRIVYSYSTYLYERIWNNGWGAQQTISNTESTYPSYYEDVAGKLSVIYKRESDDFLVEKRLVDGVWGAELVVNASPSSHPSSILLFNGTIFSTYYASLNIYSTTLQRYAQIGAGIVRDEKNATNRWVDFSNGIRFTFPIAGGTVTASIL